MLQELTIHNLALIEKLSLNFKTGFTTLTGETGAGKSILLDALGLTLGNRADSSLVRHGTARADVTANFDICQLNLVKLWLKEQELDNNEEHDCLLRRTLTAEGRSKAYINGLPVAASQLKALSSLLIDIHGQHEHQRLLSTNKQLELLDSYAQHNDLTQKYRQNYQVWSKLNQTYKILLENQEDQQDKIELLEFQLNELNSVLPTENEFKALSKEQNSLSHANEIKTAGQTAYETIDGEKGIVELLNYAINTLEKVVNYQPQLNSTLEQLNSLRIDSQEIATDLQHQNNQIELDPQRLEQVDNRLSELFILAKKHQIDPDNLINKQQSITHELTDLNHSLSTLDNFQEDINQAWLTLNKTAQELSRSRQTAAKTLNQTVSKSMHSLGMPNGLFNINLSSIQKPNQKGIDLIELQVTTNKGQPLQALAKVVSGGELSRISLAIQVACAEVASLPTLIFDEVDVGIGGGIAEVVGQQMQTLGLQRQIFSITHLPQVAAFGHQHLLIEKHSNHQKTTTQVSELRQQNRINELARMLGGITTTQQTLKHAEEMLSLAQKSSD